MWDMLLGTWLALGRGIVFEEKVDLGLRWSAHVMYCNVVL